MTTYKEPAAVVLARAENRLTDIDTCIAEGDTSADWLAEREEQVRLIARLGKKVRKAAPAPAPAPVAEEKPVAVITRIKDFSTAWVAVQAGRLSAGAPWENEYHQPGDGYLFLARRVEEKPTRVVKCSHDGTMPYAHGHLLTLMHDQHGYKLGEFFVVGTVTTPTTGEPTPVCTGNVNGKLPLAVFK